MCCFVSDPVLANIVVNVFVPVERLGSVSRPPAWAAPHLGDPRKWSRRNFYIVRFPERPRCAYTVFPRSGCVNVTGLRSTEEACEALSALGTRLDASDEEVDGWAKKIVNSTFYGSIVCSERSVTTCRVLSRAAAAANGGGGGGNGGGRDEMHISLRTQFFPGARVRWAGKGTVNFFNNGKYVIVGARSRAAARELHSKICALMGEYWTTSSGPMSCAWTADSSWIASSAAEEAEGWRRVTTATTRPPS